MSSRVIVTNNSNFCFKISSILFCENEVSAEKFWESKFIGSILSEKETIVCGKLIHSDNLPNGGNFVISIILSVEKSNSFNHHESFIILKVRVKGSKTGSKIYSYVSNYPERFSLTKAQWRKGTSKVSIEAN